MTISVRYLAQAHRAAGAAAEQVELDSLCSLPDVITRLAHRGGEPLRGLLINSAGRVQPALLLFVNDEQVAADNPQPLRDGDVVTILSPMAGG